MTMPIHEPHMPGLHTPTAHQRQIMQRADVLAARFSERVQVNDVTSIFPQENYRELHEAGYLRLALPAAYGGEGTIQRLGGCRRGRYDLPGT
jgi:alkylation response protein AidB-like acyl-CoA dehydrogenase